MSADPRRRYTFEFKAEVVRFVSEGRGGQSDAAKKFDVPVGVVHEWVKKAALPASKSNAARRIEVERLFLEEGKTYEEIASLVSAHPATVSRWLRRFVKLDPIAVRDMQRELVSLRADNQRLREENLLLRKRAKLPQRLRTDKKIASQL